MALTNEWQKLDKNFRAKKEGSKIYVGFPTNSSLETFMTVLSGQNIQVGIDSIDLIEGEKVGETIAIFDAFLEV